MDEERDDKNRKRDEKGMKLQDNYLQENCVNKSKVILIPSLKF